jgi:hypothetical protein
MQELAVSDERVKWQLAEERREAAEYEFTGDDQPTGKRSSSWISRAASKTRF